MSYQNGFRAFQQHIDSNLQTEDPWGYQANTGFWINAQTALGQFVDEEMSISSYINHEPRRLRNEKLRKMRDDGDIPKPIWDKYTRKTARGNKVDWDLLAQHAQKEGYTDIMTDEEVDSLMRTSLDRRRTYAQDVYASANGLGVAGQFTGTLHGAALDPINIVGGSFVGLKATAVGAHLLANTGRVFAKGATVGVGTEAAIQPFVMDWKHDIGVEYTLEDAMINIGVAGLATGTLSSGIQGARNLFARVGARQPKTNVTGIQMFGTEDWTYYHAKIKGLGPDADLARDALPVDYYTREMAQHPDQTITVEQFQNDMISWNRKVSEPDSAAFKQDPLSEYDAAQTQEQFDTLMKANPDAPVADVTFEGGKPSSQVRKASDVMAELKTREDTLKKVEDCFVGA